MKAARVRIARVSSPCSGAGVLCLSPPAFATFAASTRRGARCRAIPAADVTALATGRKPRHRPPGRNEENAMEVIVVQPIIALIAGILILIVPRLLNYIVAVYLIVIGLVGLLGHIV